jgi:signal transduction histidine kinase
MVRISVTDTGAGMDAATARRAIEPFFSTKGIGQGTGLGLSMVHGLAAQLGGALTIRSVPGQGTTVELWLRVGVRHPPIIRKAVEI